MNCRKVRKLHTEAAEDRLGEAEREAYRAHLESCARCRADASQMLAAAKALRAIAREKAPASLAPGALARLQRRPVGVPAWAWAPAGVLVAAVALGYLLVASPRRVLVESEMGSVPRTAERRLAKSAVRDKAALRLEPSAEAPQAGPGAQAARERKAEPSGEAGGDNRGYRPTLEGAARPSDREVDKVESGLALHRELLGAPATRAGGTPVGRAETEGAAMAYGAGSPVAKAGEAIGERAPWVPAEQPRDHWTADEVRSEQEAGRAAAPPPGGLGAYGHGEQAAAGWAGQPPFVRVAPSEGGPPGFFSVDARDRAVADVLREISTKTGAEVALKSKTEAKITVYAQGSPAELVAAVADAAGLPHHAEGDTLVVGEQPAQ